MITVPHPLVTCDGCGAERCVDGNKYTARQWIEAHGWLDAAPYHFCPGCSCHVRNEWAKSTLESEDAPRTWSGHLDRMTRELSAMEDA